MPLADQFLEAATAAPNSATLDELARQLSRANDEGAVDDAGTNAAFAAIAARRRAFAAGQGFTRLPTSSPVLGLPRGGRRHPRSPDRQASIERRRRQAMSGTVPARIAASFTTGELAVLTVIGREIQKRQVCVLCVDAIAALAGVCPRMAQSALRHAERLGLILIRERRRPGLPSLTNVITVASKDWAAWLRLAGCKSLRPSDNNSFLRGSKSQNSDQRWRWKHDSGRRRPKAQVVEKAVHSRE